MADLEALTGLQNVMVRSRRRKLGGGTGALLIEFARSRAAVHGTLVDLPGTAARAADADADAVAAAGLSDRIATVGQSFSDPLPAGADVVAPGLVTGLGSLKRGGDVLWLWCGPVGAAPGRCCTSVEERRSAFCVAANGAGRESQPARGPGRP